jgi:prefoldin alpha subunit
LNLPPPYRAYIDTPTTTSHLLSTTVKHYYSSSLLCLFYPAQHCSGLLFTGIIQIHKKKETKDLIYFVIYFLLQVNMSSPNSNGTNTINLDTMSLDQLQQLSQEQEQKLQALTQRYAQLRAAAARLHASQNAISELSPGNTAASSNTTVMVPLTESVYVPGTLKDPNQLLVEIGTGFYVEKTNKQTTEFLARKLKLVDANSENITLAVQTLQANLQQIQSAMQGKLLEIRARQQGQRMRQQGEEAEGMAAVEGN